MSGNGSQDANRVYDPRGVVDSTPLPLARRPDALKGLSLGILDNTKWNARKLLQATADLLVSEHQLGKVTFYKKESFSKVAEAALIEQIARENDLALTAIGD